MTSLFAVMAQDWPQAIDLLRQLIDMQAGQATVFTHAMLIRSLRCNLEYESITMVKIQIHGLQWKARKPVADSSVGASLVRLVGTLHFYSLTTIISNESCERPPHFHLVTKRVGSAQTDPGHL